MKLLSVVPRTTGPYRRCIWPKQSLGLCGYVCFDSGEFVNVTGSRTEFPASEVAFDDRRQIIRDALIFMLQGKFGVGSVTPNGLLLAIARVDDKFAFQCDNRAAIVCAPTVYADRVNEESEMVLHNYVEREGDLLSDALARETIGDGNLRLFLHMHGYGDNGPGCVPCRATVEAHRAFRRNGHAGHRYLRFDEEFVSLGNFFERSI